MYTLYGIPNCDTVKKAKKKLESNGVEFEFVNFKKEQPTTKQINNWKKSFGDWPINKKGRTYKQLKDEIDSLATKEIPGFIAENTSLIKRPILEEDGNVLCFGFDEEVIEGLS